MGSSLKELEAKLKAWNRDTFGNIFRRKQRARLRLQGVKEAFGRQVSEGLIKLESN